MRSRDRGLGVVEGLKGIKGQGEGCKNGGLTISANFRL